MAEEKKGVGVNPSANIHYTDHLAVVCIFMGIPLLFIDELDYELGSRYYPGLNAQKVDYDAFDPEFLIANYDVLFMSDLWDRKAFREKYFSLEMKYQKRLRNVHCPHGFSDKGFYLKKSANEDITLIYGQNMLDQLKHYQSYDNLNAYVITGNYRYTYYKKNKAFYDKIIKEEVLHQFNPDNPTILYAPTWQDLEESTSFFDSSKHILEDLPRDYNLVVKLHPRLELDDTVAYYQILGKHQGKSNIVFLKDFPLVYPLLDYADIYIGDMSSVGYDFLAFNKPMFFLNKQQRDSKTDRGLYLFRCGTEIAPEKFSKLYQTIEENLPTDKEKFGAIRQEVYDYTFGPEKPFPQIKEEIIAAYNS
ncbi:putative uncharacterized protein [Parachlamydia acanthamoebae UV-7]|uniref:CDP-glycerol:poly(Glycerophosphate) glycerophosphotransferase n=2 Tax=Parachlamydia acanthamoebae TaxID=83552 RepID=F8KUR8_PARAV|nr:CDP-glycerol glycerophosphotransferase family protein [Parachlamydia acanthamoebae]KIA76560.1 hypothetical protein DB43_AB00250 [Parachlamydia acanthamoebae]CCB84983.1 putative uncharacterized protein [Parachlamydia acanthamoebae UV-7]